MGAGVRGEPGRNVERNDGPAGGVDRLDRGRDAALGDAARARPEERVDDDVSAREQIGGGTIDVERPRADAGAPELLELARGVASDVGRWWDQQHRGSSPVTLEPAGHDEAVAAVAPLAADDDDLRAALRRAQGRQRVDDRPGSAATGILHEDRPRDAELGDRSLIEPPHLLGGEHAEHGYFPVEGGTAWTRKSARMAV